MFIIGRLFVRAKFEIRTSAGQRVALFNKAGVGGSGRTVVQVQKEVYWSECNGAEEPGRACESSSTCRAQYPHAR